MGCHRHAQHTACAWRRLGARVKLLCPRDGATIRIDRVAPSYARRRAAAVILGPWLVVQTEFDDG